MEQVRHYQPKAVDFPELRRLKKCRYRLEHIDEDSNSQAPLPASSGIGLDAMVGRSLWPLSGCHVVKALSQTHSLAGYQLQAPITEETRMRSSKSAIRLHSHRLNSMTIDLKHLPQLQPLFKLLSSGAHLNRLQDTELWVELENHQSQYRNFVCGVGF